MMEGSGISTGVRRIPSILLGTLEVDEALESPVLEHVLVALEKMDGAGVSDPKVDSMRKNPALSEADSSRTTGELTVVQYIAS